MDPNELLPHPKNPNKHPDKQIRLLAKVISHQGWRSPVVISKNSGYVVAGHCRRLAAILLGTLCPVEYQEFKNNSDELAHLLADNQIQELAEMELEDVSSLLKELETVDFDVEFAGFETKKRNKENDPIIDGVVGKVEVQPASLEVFHSIDDFKVDESGDRIAVKGFGEISPDTKSVITLKDDAFFDSNLPFGIPPLRPDMLGDIPDPIGTWINEKRTAECENYFWVYGGDSIRGLPLDRTVLGFYTDDERFELTWDNVVDFTTRLLKLKLRGVVGPNFSMYDHSPQAYYVWNSFRSKYIARFWQEAGIKIVPDVYIRPEQRKFNWLGIPKNCPCLSMQYQVGQTSLEGFNLERQWAKEMIEELKPQSLFIYTTDPRFEQISKAFPKELHVIKCINAITLRSEAIKSERAEKGLLAPHGA